MARYSRYSHHARRALTHAGLLANRYHHPRIDTGHLLVGVLLTEGSIGHSVLTELKLNADMAAPRLASLTLPIDTPPEVISNDAALDIALELAADESSWLGHHYIGTEHLLLGITRTNVGNASDLLRLLSVQPEQVRRRVRRALSDGMTEFSLQLARRNARFSELSRRVLNAAEQIAISLDHQTVGIGHLLLVLVRERRSLPSMLLQRDLNEDQLEHDLYQRHPVLLVNVEGVLNLAVEHAQSLGSHYTGTEHLLLAMTLDATGAEILRVYGAKPDALRQVVEEQLRSSH